MKGATLCSGIGAPECAAPWIDWIWSSDIEPFPNAVRAVRYPDSINLGDMTAEDFVARAAAIGLPDVLVAGTPCQAFSVAGLRQSLADDRGNLTLLFVRICDAIDNLRRAAGLAPLWIVWENVPGVLSVKDNAFGAFVAGLGGHDAPIVPPGRGRWTNAGVVSGPRRGVAWRILDAQHFGVAQRRRRIFLLARGGAGNFHGADALLPIIDRLRWHPAPSREKGEIAPTIPARSSGGGGLGTDFDLDGGLINDRVSPTLDASINRAVGSNQWVDNGYAIAAPMAFGDILPTMSTRTGTGTGNGGMDDYCIAVPAFHPTQDPISSTDISHALGTGSTNGQASIAVAVSLRGRDGGGTAELGGDISPALRASQGGGDKPHVMAFHENQQGDVRTSIVSSALSKGGGKPGQGYPAVAIDPYNQSEADVFHTMRTDSIDGIPATYAPHPAIRRLTPRECERLQGFPDDWTRIAWRNKPVEACPDAPRYKALGNSMAVPVMTYILDQIRPTEDGGQQ